MAAAAKKLPSKTSATILRARVVLPISGAAIENGAVGISGQKISYVGRWRGMHVSKGVKVMDLGDAILLPGLINAHCHLDYTRLARQIPPPANFVDWLKSIMAGKAGWIFSDFAESWLAGAKMLVRNGVTTVGDIEMSPELLPDIWSATPLRVISFLELTGVKSRRPPMEIVDEAMEKVVNIPSGRCRMGLSPHAPYSTTPELMRLVGQAANRRRLPVATHVAESAQEFEMFSQGSGKMYDWIARSGRNMSDCALGSPVQHLEHCGLLNSRLLAVHVNYLAPGDAQLLAKRKVSVVHCPRSHAYFKHRKFPLEELNNAGVNICLGTDSLASVYAKRKEPPELSLFDEMRAMATSYPELEPQIILKMATINGAKALGMKRSVGRLEFGSFADLVAVPFKGKLSDATEAVVSHRGAVEASMIGGEWALEPQSDAIPSPA